MAEQPQNKFQRFLQNANVGGLKLFDQAKDKPGLFTTLGVALEGISQGSSGEPITAFDKFRERMQPKKPSLVDILAIQSLPEDQRQQATQALLGQQEEVNGEDTFKQFIEKVKEAPLTLNEANLLNKIVGADIFEKSPQQVGMEKGLQEAAQEAVKRPEAVKTKQEEQAITTAGQVEAQAGKAGELMGRQAERAAAATGTAMETMFDFGERQLELTGTKPGDFLGIVDRLTPSQANEFKNAFEGAATESASLTARQLIPGVRAANITKIFEGSTAQLGKTVESNAANVSASMQNAFTGTLTENTLVEDENGNKVRIQDVTLDPETGKPLSELGFEQKTKAINRLGKEFKDRNRLSWLKEAFKRNPELLRDRSKREIFNTAPKFDTVEELEQSGLQPGEIVVVGGQIGVFE